jgi:hypothetical protein
MLSGIFLNVVMLSVICDVCHLWCLSFMMSFIRLNVIMLSIFYADCHLC